MIGMAAPGQGRPAAKPPAYRFPRFCNSRFTSRLAIASGWTTDLRPSTAPPEQVRGSARDEGNCFVPSKTYPHPEQRHGEAATRVEGHRTSVQPRVGPCTATNPA